MVVTSPRNAAMIGWEYAGGACLNHLSECFASAGAEQMIQELVTPVDDTGDPTSDAMTPNYAHAHGSPLLPQWLGYGPTRWVTALVNLPANEVHYLRLTSAGPSHDGVRVSGQRSPCETKFWSAPKMACSTPAHAHVDVPFRYLSYGLGLHRNYSGRVAGGLILLTISNG